MKQYLFSVIKHLIFWLLFFAIGRVLFLLANISLLSEIGFTDIILTFFYSIKLDFSAACYLTVIPFVLLTIQLAFNAKWINFVLKIYMLIFIILCLLITFSDIGVYQEWSYKLNYKALVYLKQPLEILKSAKTTILIISVLGIAVLSFGSFICYNRLILKPFVEKKQRFYIPAFLILIIGSGSLFVGMRGGLSEIPISQSSSYFSNHQILNDAAVNPEWNLIHSCSNFLHLNNANPFVFMDSKKAEQIVAELHVSHPDSTFQVIKSDSINIVVILLESWSADLIESLDGKPGITPYFHELEKEGILFTDFYANGHRSQLGISAFLSGFPPIPIISITDNMEKYSHLNSLSKDLNLNGYKSSFFFGGDLNYGNLKAYLMYNQFDQIFDENKFPPHSKRGKLSIFDEELFNFHNAKMQNEKNLFFSVVFTASTHSPYDEPKIVEQLDWDVIELPYLNSAKYTDYCLGKYFEQVKNEEWYKNTLFILMADHSHITYKNWNYYSKGYQRIPMLWLGGALKDEFVGTKYDKLCSQMDVPATILGQLKIKNDNYEWSKDIFNPSTQQFAMFETNNGLVWIRKNCTLSYDGFGKRCIKSETISDSVLMNELENGKAYLQVLYDNYLKY